MAVGILSLVFYNDIIVKDYFARLNGTPAPAPVTPTEPASIPQPEVIEDTHQGAPVIEEPKPIEIEQQPVEEVPAPQEETPAKPKRTPRKVAGK
jgi:hypothetical protein